MSRILKIEGFSDLKKRELSERCNDSYPRRIKFIENFLNSVENFFVGYWKVKGNSSNGSIVRLRRLKYSKKVDENAWILLPGDMEELLERLIWMPIGCIKLEGGVMGVPIHYEEIGGISKMYCIQGIFSENQFYLTPREDKSKFLNNPPPLFLQSLKQRK